jgi:hypothetical protein
LKDDDDPGRDDGVMDKERRAAMRDYQRDNEPITNVNQRNF